MSNARITGPLSSLPQSTDVRRSPVLSLVDAAARRRTLTLALQHSALTLLALLTGAVLLLLLGTDLLAWPWLVSLAVAGLVLTVVRFRRDLAGRYSVAQMVDSRLRLNDSLSTAWYLLSHPGESGSSLADAQIVRAEQSAFGLEPGAAFPFVWRQRTWAAVGALAVLAFGLFAARYLVTSTLSLKPSLLPFHALFYGQEIAASKRDYRPLAGETEGAGNHPARRMPTPAVHEKENRSAQQQPTRATGSKGSGLAPEKQKLANNSDEASISSPNPASHNGAQASNLQPRSQAGDAKAKEGGQRDDPAAREAQSEGSQTPASSLAERMKEALSGLLDKMRPRNGTADSGPGERAQQNRDAANADPTARSQNESNNRNSKSPQDQDQGRSQNASAQASAQASEKMPGPASRASDQSAGRKGNDAHSGIGRQDGEKTLREAEQLRAMGKLQEIIGKRSASLTGAMTVETQSGKQQLQTQYSGRLGNHADLGGEIDRNEVPVALQNYVREYMEQVRKQPSDNQ